MAPERDIFMAAENLLIRCGGLRPGDRVLVLHEPAGLGYYDDEIAGRLVKAARDLGLDAAKREVPFNASPVLPCSELAAAMAAVDLTVFLARLGDQIRFQALPGHPRAVVCYALSAPALAGVFGQLDHRGMLALRDLVDTALAEADDITVTCAAGTDLRGRIARGAAALSDTRTIRFPLLVNSPVPARGFTGRIAQRGFLVGTGSQFYQPYACLVDDTLYIEIEGNRIASFTGTPKDVARAKAHYAQVAHKFGIDERFVHSWHAGIHPGCAFEGPASDCFLRWSGSAFGNPRLLHVHTCGAYAPGEISLNVLDPTVTADGVALWDAGRFHPERLAGGNKVLEQYPAIRAAFEAPEQACGARPGGLSFD